MDLPDIILRPWQEEILALLALPPVKRKIIWIWSEASSTGKSTFSDYVMAKYKTLKGSAEMKRTLYAYDKHEVIWFDWARQQPMDAWFISQIENLSNCSMHQSEMHHPVMKLVKAHIIVSSNRPPPKDKLPGRCEVWCLDPVADITTEEKDKPPGGGASVGGFIESITFIPYQEPQENFEENSEENPFDD